MLITPRLQLAILTDNKDASSRRVRVGEVVPGSNWRLVSLEPRRAVMEGPSGQRELQLRVFDGKGGQPPTPMSMRPANNVRPDTVPPADAKPSLSPPPEQQPQQVQPAPKQQPNPDLGATPLSQEQQVEAIRRRIEARRAQMRAEAAAASAEEK